jgi:NADH-quinone oxidoreductase subunit D
MMDGDCHNRYLCRMAVMRDSTKIVVQAIEGMPKTPGDGKKA